MRITTGCFGRDRETPDNQEMDVIIRGSLIDGVFHGKYEGSNFVGGGQAHTLTGQYNNGSKCGEWISVRISMAASPELVMSYMSRPVDQDTFPPC